MILLVYLEFMYHIYDVKSCKMLWYNLLLFIYQWNKESYLLLFKLLIYALFMYVIITNCIIYYKSVV